MELRCLICMYATLHVLFVYCDMLKFEPRVIPRILTEDTNGTSTSPMARNNRRQRTIDRHSIWKYDQGFGFVVGRLKFIFAVIQDLTPAVQYWRGSKEGKGRNCSKGSNCYTGCCEGTCQIWPIAELTRFDCVPDMTHCRIHILFSPDSVPWEESYNIRMYFQTGILTVPRKQRGW